MNQRGSPVVFVVSDGRGETATQVLRAALVQFEGQQFDMVVRPEILTVEQVNAVTREAAERKAIVFFTLVSRETRWALVTLAEELLVPTVDVLGPSFSALHDLVKREPSGKPGLYDPTDRERLDRHAAIDYTLTHDDGQRPDELQLADVVLVGVSRAAKSTTCFYLAFRGVKAANVPLVHGISTLPQLAALDPSRVIGLNVNVSRLMSVRQARAHNLGNKHLDYYTSKKRVADEVRQANTLMKQYGWRTIDTSYLAIEEIAREVMLMIGRNWHGGDPSQA